MAEPTSMTLGATDVVTLSVASAKSDAIGTANSGQPGATTTVRLAATVACWIKIAADADATAVANTDGSAYLPADTVEYFDVPFGHKVAAIAAEAGYLSVTPMSKT